MSGKSSKGYPSDVTDEEWEFVLPYLLLCREDSAQRRHDLRRVFNGVRYAARTGGQWRYLPHEYGPWWAVYQQMRRWLDAGVFEALVADVQSIVREWVGRKSQPTAICIDSRTLQSTPESGARAGYDGAKRRNGSKVHIAVDTLGHLLALTVTAGDRGDREQVAALAAAVQEVTGSTVDLAYVDQGYTGPNAAEAAQQHGIRLEVVKHPMAKRGFVLLPRRWVVERSFAWAARFRRLARDYERLDTSLKGFHYIAFAILMTNKLINAALTSTQQALGAEKTPSGLEALRAPTFPHHGDEQTLHGSLHMATRTKEQVTTTCLKPDTTMVSNDRGVYKDRHVRISSWPGETISTQRRIHLRRLVFSTKLPLAVARRTIHCRDLQTREGVMNLLWHGSQG